MQDQFPENDRLVLVSASLLWRQKKNPQSIELLQSFAKDHPDQSLRVQLSLAQLQLEKGNTTEALSLLESIASLRNKPGMIATLVSLHEQLGNIDVAIKVFDDYTASLEVQHKRVFSRDQKVYRLGR